MRWYMYETGRGVLSHCPGSVLGWHLPKKLSCDTEHCQTVRLSDHLPLANFRTGRYKNHGSHADSRRLGAFSEFSVFIPASTRDSNLHVFTRRMIPYPTTTAPKRPSGCLAQ